MVCRGPCVLDFASRILEQVCATLVPSHNNVWALVLGIDITKLRHDNFAHDQGTGWEVIVQDLVALNEALVCLG